jgi:hypothetical protein
MPYRMDIMDEIDGLARAAAVNHASERVRGAGALTSGVWYK